MPTVYFDVVVKREKKRASVSSQPPPHISPTSLLKVEPLVGELPETAAGAAFNLSVCSTYILPECLRALYNIPIATMDK
jgi:tripeptidyl-peptidase I